MPRKASFSSTVPSDHATNGAPSGASALPGATVALVIIASCIAPPTPHATVAPATSASSQACAVSASAPTCTDHDADAAHAEDQHALLRKEIMDKVRDSEAEVRACYNVELKHDPNLRGKLMVQFKVAPDGAVVDPGVWETTLGNRAVETCVLKCISRWRFRRGGGPKETNVIPFSFVPHASDADAGGE
jgi:outer membrane biosynthesis protein TonB